MAKTYAATYLYSQYSEYEKQIFSFLMSGTEIDKDSPDFEDIKYEVKKRQISNSLFKLIESKEIVLMTAESPLPKSFKVFCANDVKQTKNQKKVFIDCTNIIQRDAKTGRYICKGNNIDIFVSYLVSAMHTLIYYADENRITSNAKLTFVGASAFASLVTYVIDYACKISSMPSQRSKCMYMAALYYQSNILGKDHTTAGARQTAKKISGLSDREAGIVDVQINATSMMNIKYFIESLSNVLHINKLTLDIVVERWMTAFGTGTIFALELFPAFASMVTDTYVGAYLNNQKSIEKIIGTDMTEFTKTLLSIGADSI